MTLQLIIESKMLKKNEKKTHNNTQMVLLSCLKMLKCQQLEFHIYDKNKFQTQFSWAWKQFYNLGVWLNTFSNDKRGWLKFWIL